MVKRRKNNNRKKRRRKGFCKNRAKARKINASSADAQVHGAIEYTLGSYYTWDPGEPTVSGGTLNFKGLGIGLNRTESEFHKPAIWKRSP